jgi:hypothetical protein
MSHFKERFKIEVHDGTGLESVYGRLRFTAATKLQPWDEIQPVKGKRQRKHMVDRLNPQPV